MKQIKRFYFHEVELKKKLDDVFLTPFGRTSSSSKSIIADLIKKYNHNINIYKQDANENTGNQKLIAGYSYSDVMDKLQNLYEQFNLVSSKNEEEDL